MLGKMRAAAPSAELVYAAKDATETFIRAGGASLFTGELGEGGQEYSSVQ